MTIRKTSDFPLHVGPTNGYFVCQAPSCQKTYEQERFKSLAEESNPDPNVKCESCGGYVIKQGNVNRSTIKEARPIYDPEEHRAQLVRDKQELIERRRTLQEDERKIQEDEEDLANGEYPLDVNSQQALIQAELEHLDIEETQLKARRTELLSEMERLRLVQRAGGAS